MTTDYVDAVAAVVREPSGPFSVEPVRIRAPRADEALVRVHATGLCHTDLKAWKAVRPAPLPAVLGHEGAGVVESVGEEVEALTEGDKVVASFASCGACALCRQGREQYCVRFVELNFGGSEPDGSILLADGKAAHGSFFGQSTFASHAVIKASQLVRVPDALPLEQLGPLGCGLMTGAGAVLNVLRPSADDVLAIWGLGAVGFGALMAAATETDCKEIVAIDLHAERLEVARELGATACVQAGEGVDVRAALAAVGADGPTRALDTTASPAVLRDATESLAPGGAAAFVGGVSAGTTVSFEVNELLQGRSVHGVVMGDAAPDEFIPRLVDLFAEGRFPIDRLTSTYPLQDIERAIAETESGSVVKAVLLPPKL